ncbi:MAG: hypothetical protein LLG00_11840 [Planctomycetaceae bacterium]|nr:hypothetical protein [Planctomycetaceae bacterium]
MRATIRWATLLTVLTTGLAVGALSQSAERAAPGTDSTAGDEGGALGDRRPPGPPPDGFAGGHGERLPWPPRETGESLGALKKSNPELYKLTKKEGDLERRIIATAKKYRAASKDQQEKIKDELRKLAAEQFDVGQQRRALELKHREKTKDQIIERRVLQAVSQTEAARRGHRGPMGHGGDEGMPRMGPPGKGLPPE